MQVFVMSRGRARRELQATAQFLGYVGVPFTFVVYPDEKKQYERLGFNAIVDGSYSGPKGIGPKRDYVIHELSKGAPVLMLDDDLKFFVRRTDDPTKFRDGTPEEFQGMLRKIARNVTSGRFPLVGIASREGGNRNTEEYLYDTRTMRVLAYDSKVLIENNIRFSEIPVMEDFHVALSLLKLGHHNLVLNGYCHNQFGSGLEGGCSTYRTPEVQAEAAHRLAELHPGLVKVVQKETKGAWGGGARTDVVISWKKAFNAN